MGEEEAQARCLCRNIEDLLAEDALAWLDPRSQRKRVGVALHPFALCN